MHQECLLDWINSRLTEESGRLGQAVGGPLLSSPLSCPQCHSPYKLTESYLLPRPVLTIIEACLSVNDYAITVGFFGAIAGSVWIICFAYGSITFTMAVGLEEAIYFFSFYSSPFIRLASSVYNGSRFSDYQGVLMGWLKLVVGIPLIPAAILSQRFRMMSGLLPLLMPMLLMNNDPRALSLMNWPPSPNLTALFIPHIYSGYGWLRRKYIWRQSSSRLSSLSASNDGVDSDLYDEADLAIKIGEDSIISLLLLPAASAFTGWFLFRSSGLRGFHRTCLGGLVVTVASDIGRYLYQWQADYAKRSRRVLDYFPK